MYANSIIQSLLRLSAGTGWLSTLYEKGLSLVTVAQGTGKLFKGDLGGLCDIVAGASSMLQFNHQREPWYDAFLYLKVLLREGYFQDLERFITLPIGSAVTAAEQMRATRLLPIFQLRFAALMSEVIKSNQWSLDVRSGCMALLNTLVFKQTLLKSVPMGGSEDDKEEQPLAAVQANLPTGLSLKALPSTWIKRVRFSSKHQPARSRRASVVEMGATDGIITKTQSISFFKRAKNDAEKLLQRVEEIKDVRTEFKTTVERMKNKAKTIVERSIETAIEAADKTYNSALVKGAKSMFLYFGTAHQQGYATHYFLRQLEVMLQDPYMQKGEVRTGIVEAAILEVRDLIGRQQDQPDKELNIWANQMWVKFPSVKQGLPESVPPSKELYKGALSKSTHSLENCIELLRSKRLADKDIKRSLDIYVAPRGQAEDPEQRKVQFQHQTPLIEEIAFKLLGFKKEDTKKEEMKKQGEEREEKQRGASVDASFPSKLSSIEKLENDKASLLPVGNSQDSFFQRDPGLASVLLLKGRGGTGKSTFSYKLEKLLWERLGRGGYLPIFLPLKGVRRISRDLVSNYLQSTFGLSREQVEDLREQKSTEDKNQRFRFLFLFDGYDEISVSPNLWQEARLDRWYGAKMLVTCRPSKLGPSYLKSFEVSEKKKDRPLFHEFWMSPFQPTQQKEFLDEYVKQGQKRAETEKKDWQGWQSSKEYKEHLDKLQGLDALKENPFMLSIIAKILPSISSRRNSSLGPSSAPSTVVLRSTLFQVFTSLWFEREAKKVLPKRQQLLSEAQSADPSRLRYRCQVDDSKEALQLDYQLFCEDVSCLFHVRGVLAVPHQMHWQLESAQSLRRDHVRSGITLDPVLDDYFSGLSRATSLVRRGTLIQKQGNAYSFLHKNFYEYFLACRIHREAMQSFPLKPARDPKQLVEIGARLEKVMDPVELFQRLGLRFEEAGMEGEAIESSKEIAAAESSSSVAKPWILQGRWVFKSLEQCRAQRKARQERTFQELKNEVPVEKQDLLRKLGALLRYELSERWTWEEVPLNPSGDDAGIAVSFSIAPKGKAEDDSVGMEQKGEPEGKNVQQTQGTDESPKEHNASRQQQQLKRVGQWVWRDPWERHNERVEEQCRVLSEIKVVGTDEKSSRERQLKALRRPGLALKKIIQDLQEKWKDRIRANRSYEGKHRLSLKEELRQHPEQLLLNTINLSAPEQASVLGFLGDMASDAKMDPAGNFVKTLHYWVQSSALNSKARQGAANAAAILALAAKHRGSAAHFRKELAGVQLPGAALHGWRASGANLKGADLQGADLNGALLGSADLRGTNLEDTKLMKAYLVKARLSGAMMKGVKTGEYPALIGHENGVTSVAYSADGKRVVSGSDDKTVKVWDADSGTVLQTLEGHSNYVYSVAFSPDGKRVVSGSTVPLPASQTLTVWSTLPDTTRCLQRGL